MLRDIVNHQQRLDRTFAALVDPTRRALLQHLERKSSASVGELAAPFAIKLPGILKHLGVLENAGLVTRRKSGRVVTVSLRAQPIREAMAWLERYEHFWSRSLDRLAARAEAREAKLKANGR
jgi:DNA-binding transcriptional ArsR family regulator